MNPSIWLLLFCLVAACSPFRPPLDPVASSHGRILDEVPFYPQQERYDCGSAALASLLARRDADVSLEQIRAATYTPALQGSLLPDLENYARSLGYATRSGRGNLTLLRQAIDADIPVLIPLEMGRWLVKQPHYVVILGYAGDDWIVHTGQRAGMTLSASELDRRWQKLNRLYLYLE